MSRDSRLSRFRLRIARRRIQSREDRSPMRVVKVNGAPWRRTLSSISVPGTVSAIHPETTARSWTTRPLNSRMRSPGSKARNLRRAPGQDIGDPYRGPGSSKIGGFRVKVSPHCPASLPLRRRSRMKFVRASWSRVDMARSIPLVRALTSPSQTMSATPGGHPRQTPHFLVQPRRRRSCPGSSRLRRAPLLRSFPDPSRGSTEGPPGIRS